jgi:hypothetical protein
VYDPRIHTLYRWAAERSAVLLGRQTGSSALYFWLDLLRENSPNFQKTQHTEHGADVDAGDIQFLCTASEEYCFERETACISKKLGVVEPETRALPAGEGDPATQVAPKPERRRGPTPDYKTAVRVAVLIGRIAIDAPWWSKLDDICLALDDEGVPRPKTWRKRGYGDWFDCLSGERNLVVKAINHHLSLAKRVPKV